MIKNEDLNIFMVLIFIRKQINDLMRGLSDDKNDQGLWFSSINLLSILNLIKFIFQIITDFQN